jgi:predicted LPLAT superfamily acyltransferase
MSGEPGAQAWAGRSLGGAAGHRLVHAFARLGGRRLCYLLLIPPTCWYFAVLAPRRRLIASYWRRMRPGLGRWGSLVMAWRHFYSFARLLSDRFLIAQPGALGHRSLSFQRLQAATRDPRGCLMLSAHVGNWELSGRFLASYGIAAFNLVMLDNEDPRIAAEVHAALGTRGISVISLKDPMQASLLIVAALARGETCCMLADRTAGDLQHTLAVPFCGLPARFPTGPFIAAALTGALILPTFCIKTGAARYTTFALPPWRLRFSTRAARSRELQGAVARFARELEWVVRRYPLQWHNFYDFWQA